LSLTLPADGTYYLRLGDAQRHGGGEYGYRLRVRPERPDFQLRVVPASVNARAGAAVPITVHALRRDGFDGDVTLRLKDAPRGFALSGAWVPAGQDRVRLTLTVPPWGRPEPFALQLEGSGVIEGREVVRPAVPAEDMMQAFIYRHLVPAEQWLVAVRGRARSRLPLRVLGEKPVRLPAGGTAEARLFVPSSPLLSQIQLVLSDPPAGITLRDVSQVTEGVALVLHADAGQVSPGLKGNLVVDAFVQRATRQPGGAKRRFPVGVLPAIPFEVVSGP
jgi:hypothetical protein